VDEYDSRGEGSIESAGVKAVADLTLHGVTELR
jgi:hypothetical protein